MTTFGIFWGTCSIVLLFAFGQGLREKQIQSQRGMGENILVIWPGVTSLEYKGLPKGRRIRMTEDDVKSIRQQAQLIQRVSPEYIRWGIPVKRGRNLNNRRVHGVWPEYGEMRNIIPVMGSRFINQADIDEQRRVCVIGDRLAKDLFPRGGGPIGETLLIQGVPFVIVGVMKEKRQDSSYSGRDAWKIWIPSSTYRTMWTQPYPNNVVAQIVPTATGDQGESEINSILARKYRFDPDDPRTLGVWDTTRNVAFMKNLFDAFQGFLVGIGILTLITGAIGVSNIMYVVLEERTKEIGIKMALGARRSYVITQFLSETMLLTLVGGFLGFLFAALIIRIFPTFGLEEFVGIPRVNLFIGVMITVLLGIVALGAGIFPALRASRLQPVQALKLF